MVLQHCLVLEQNSRYYLLSILNFFLIKFFMRNEMFSEIHFLTKVVLESIIIDLHTSYAPLWNGISISNLLILSNLHYSGLIWHSYAKYLCSFFLDQTLYVHPLKKRLTSLLRLSIRKNPVSNLLFSPLLMLSMEIPKWHWN